MSRRHSDSRAVTTTSVDHSAEILPPHHASGDPVAETSIFRSKKGGLNVLGFATRLSLQALDNQRTERIRQDELDRERRAHQHEIDLIKAQNEAEIARLKAEMAADAQRLESKQQTNQMRNRLLGFLEEKLRASVGMNKKAGSVGIKEHRVPQKFC